MLKKERLQWILEKINVKGVITVNDIIKELGVSDMTVRRDLDELDKEGLLIYDYDPTPMDFGELGRKEISDFLSGFIV